MLKFIVLSMRTLMMCSLPGPKDVNISPCLCMDLECEEQL